MWLFFQEADEFATGGFSPIAGGESLYKAGLAGVNFAKQMEILTTIESKALSVQKIIGSGVVNNTEAFREKLTQVYFKVSEVGGTFKDVTDVVSGLYSSLGKMVEPTSDVSERMIYLSKTTGIASDAVGKMVGDFMNLTFSQTKSADIIEKVSKTARLAGVNVKATLETVQKNLDKVNAYGFKNGIEGLTKMTVQAQQLRTTVEEIGAAQLGQTFWDPEKAIEAAAGMSMLGGSMSNLMNPFQLMNMGANNVEKLQESLIDLSASAYKVNETTGEVETNFVAQQRLKQQLEALGKGGEYEKFINLGKEAAKQKMILDDISKSGLGELFTAEGGTFSEEDQRLIASLSEINNGKVSLNIPGFGEIDDLKTALTGNPEQIKSALEKYQEKAKLSDRAIAEKSLSTTEQQAIDIRVIRETLIRSNIIGEQGRNDMVNLSKSLQGQEATLFQNTANQGVTGYEQIQTFFKSRVQKMEDEKGEMSDEDRESQRKNKHREQTDSGDIFNDGFFSEGKKTLSMGKNQMFNFIDDDQAVFAPNLDKILGILKSSYLKMKEIVSSNISEVNFKQPEIKTPDFSKIMDSLGLSTAQIESMSNKETVQKIEGSGSVNINVNISSSGDLASSLISDRRFKNDLETEILNTLKNKDLLMVKK